MRDERYDYFCKAGLIISFISHLSSFIFHLSPFIFHFSSNLLKVNIFSLILGEYFFALVWIPLVCDGNAIGSTECTTCCTLLPLLFLLLVGGLEVVGIKVYTIIPSPLVVFFRQAFEFLFSYIAISHTSDKTIAFAQIIECYKQDCRNNSDNDNENDEYELHRLCRRTYLRWVRTESRIYHAMTAANPLICRNASKIMLVSRKMYFTSLPFHPQVLNFRANMGISAINR